MTSQGVATAATPLFVRVTPRETAGFPDASVVQAGVTVTTAEQEGEEAAEEEVEVEEASNAAAGDDGGAPTRCFHGEADLLDARVRPPPPPAA